MSAGEKKGGMTVGEAGLRGGTRVLAERGHAFYEAIGKKGGDAVKAARGPEFYRDIGERGGKAAHAKHPDLAKRAGAKGGAVVKEAMALLKAQKEKKP